MDQSKFLTSYIEPIHRNFSNGVNFALAGATARGSGIYSLGVQVLEFIYFRNESISSSRDEGQLGEAEFQNALYTVDIGQNDITGAFKQGHTYDEVVSITIPAIVSSIVLPMRIVYYIHIYIYICRGSTKSAGGNFGCTTPAPWVVCRTR